MTHEAADPVRKQLDRELGRRDFLRAAAGGTAALAAASAAAAIGIERAPRPVSYLGIRVSAESPTPFGLPLIPIRADPDGHLEAIPRNLAAHRIACAHDEPPGLDRFYPGDNLLRFHTPGMLRLSDRTGPSAWRHDGKQGRPIHRDDVKDLTLDAPLGFSWRSEDLDEEPGHHEDRLLRGLLIRIDPQRLEGEDATDYLLADPPLLAVNATCTHLRCTINPDPDAPRALICPCHGSRFDPYRIDRFTFDPRQDHLQRLRAPRPAADRNPTPHPDPD